jgi:hypothetical protein
MNFFVNKNIDEYTEDFYKGLSPYQCVCSAIAVAVGGGVFVLTHSLLGVPQLLSIYMTTFIAAPIAVIGFAKIKGLPILEYIRRKRVVQSQSEFFYETDNSNEIEDTDTPTAWGKKIAQTAARIWVKTRKQKTPQLQSQIVTEAEAERWLDDELF